MDVLHRFYCLSISENLALHRPTFTNINAIDSIISFAGKANRPDKLVDGDLETCILEPYVLKERWWTVELDQHYQVDTIVVYHSKSPVYLTLYQLQ